MTLGQFWAYIHQTTMCAKKHRLAMYQKAMTMFYLPIGQQGSSGHHAASGLR